MDYVRIKRGARLCRVIVDRYNSISPHANIGFDPDQDRLQYKISPSGLVVVSSGLPGRRTNSFAGGYI